MTEPIDTPFTPGEAPVQRFAHNAMATTFELFIAGETAEYARQVALEAYALLDRLEEELSRYIPFSDIARISALRPGEWATVGLAAWDCLRLTQRIHTATGGAFDPTIGPLLDWWRGPEANDNENIQDLSFDLDQLPGWRAARARTGLDRLIVSPTEPLVSVRAEGLSVDLGAIGKGYAVDQVALLLRDWDIGAAVIHGGQSSAYALGAPPDSPPGELGWRLSLRDPLDHSRTLAPLCLRDRSLSGSGVLLHGNHIIDPRTGRPAAGRPGAWALAPTAAESDAISTAFMIMDEEAIAAYCHTHPEVAGMICRASDAGPVLRRFGVWPDEEERSEANQI